MPATRRPSFQFYPGDWLKDPSLRSVSIAARGLWIDLLCHMSEASQRGYLCHPNFTPISEKQIARMVGVAPQSVKKLLQELGVSGVFSRTETEGIIYSRRMVDDERKYQQDRENGKKGGNPYIGKRVNPQDNPDGNPNTPPSSSSSSSSSFSSSFSQERELSLSRGMTAEPEKKPPSLDVVKSYCCEQKIGVNAEAFFHHYSSVGWKIGKTPIEDWQAALRKWAANERPSPSPAKSERHPASMKPPFDDVYQQNRKRLLELGMKYSTLVKDLSIDQIMSAYRPPRELGERLRKYKNWRSISRDDGLRREFFEYLEISGIEGIQQDQGL